MRNVHSIYDQLREDEGEVLHAYKDIFGYLSIGIGRMIDVRKNGGISAEEASILLHNDVKEKKRELGQRFPWMSRMDEVRYGVFLNMAFQLGVDGLSQFHNTLACAERGDWEGTARNMRDSKWARQTPERAQRLITQIKTGIWQ